MNALHMPLWEEITDVFRRCSDDPLVRCVVLGGEGEHRHQLADEPNDALQRHVLEGMPSAAPRHLRRGRRPGLLSAVLFFSWGVANGD